MKNIVIVSVLSLLLSTPMAFGSDGYGRIDKTQLQSYGQNVQYASRQEKAAANRQQWEQMRRRFEMAPDDSYTMTWNDLTEAYQRQKKIQY